LKKQNLEIIINILHKMLIIITLFLFPLREAYEMFIYSQKIDLLK
jgi:hypothetical protein